MYMLGRHVGEKLVVVVASVSAILFPTTFITATTLPEISPEQKKTCEFFGVPSTMCRPADIVILQGGCELNPYPILESRYKSSNVHITPRGDGDNLNLTGGINPSLACRLVKFFEYAEKNHGCRNIKIISAYRSAQQQENLCGDGGTGCAPAGKSCHQYGLAIDISSSCTEWMRSFLGKKNPNSAGAQQFQLHFPYSGDHIQCIENIGASCNPNTRGCDGKAGITPELGVVRRPPPTTAFSNAVRQWLAPQQSQPQQVVTATPSQPASASQNPLTAFQEPQTIGGVSGQLTMTPAATNTNSVADRLEALAFPTTTQTGSTATTVPLVISGAQAVQLSAGQQAPTTPTYTGSGAVSPSQSTFISGDLSWQGAPQVPQTLTGFQATLANVRAILERILAFLTPFNTRNAVLEYAGEQEIYILE